MGDGEGSNSRGGWLFACASMVFGSSVAIGAAQPSASVQGQDAAAVAPAARPTDAANGVTISPAPAAIEPSQHCAERFVQPLRDLDLLSPREADAREVVADPRAYLRHGILAEVIVATIADPLDSGLSYQFDAALRAIFLGGENEIAQKGEKTPSRYYRDRSWLPWDDRSLAGEKRGLSEDCRASTPGILVFRRAGERFLLVLLVGETPIRGLHGEAMGRALQVAAALTDPRELRIVGPMYSGSARSLRHALEKWAESDRDIASVRIVTGAATGANVPDLLNSRNDPQLRGKDVTLQATIAPEDAVRCAYLKFLKYRLGVAEEAGAEPEQATAEERKQPTLATLPEVAFLHESGTEFGAGSPQEGQAPDCMIGHRTPKDASGAPPEKSWFEAALDHLSDLPPGKEPEKERRLVAGVDLSFPVHVSMLRDAYEEMDRQAPGPAELGIARRTSLGISLREPRHPIDLPAVSARSVYSQDLALSNLLGVIAERNVRHVGIQATDIGDAIFLARKLRDITPDVRIAFLTSDVLVMHSSFERDLAGSLVVSSYPFLGTGGLGNRVWDRAGGAPDFTSELPRQDAFESAPAIGVFNAVLAARRADPKQLRDYVFGESGARLPVWISALVGGRLHPISARPSRDPNGILYGGEPKASAYCEDLAEEFRGDPDRYRRQMLNLCPLGMSKGMEMPRSWHFAFGLLCLATALDHSFRRRGLTKLASPPLLTSTRGGAPTELAIERTKWLLYAALRSVALAFPLAYMTLTYFIAYRVYAMPGVWSTLALCVALGLVALALASAAHAIRAFAKNFIELWRHFNDARRFGTGPLESLQALEGAPSAMATGGQSSGGGVADDPGQSPETMRHYPNEKAS